MTREELCIHACKYAIGELTRKGSSGFITSAHEGGQQITWVEVMEWLNREWCEDDISRYGVPHKIAEFFSNWDGDENAKMEISVKDMREISGMFVSKCRAESKLKALQKPCEEEMKQQKIKTGHWIPSHIPESILDECSECGFSCGAFTFNYCPNCGCRMVKPQKSEDKE